MWLVPATEYVSSFGCVRYSTLRQFPWSRELWALLLDRMFQAGTRLVVFDLVFSPPDDGDPVFRAALDRYRDKVVIGANFDLSQASVQGGAALNAVNVPPNASLIPPPQMEDDRVGYVIFYPDFIDPKIRSARYTITDRQLARGWPQHQLFAAGIACRSAVTIRYHLAAEEIRRLLNDWLRCADRFTCPHGRPVVLSMSEVEMEKYFKRR